MGSNLLEVIHADDISAGGIAFHVPYAFSEKELAEEVQLVIKIPGEKCFLARAVIRNINPRGKGDRYGLQFTVLDDDHGDAIARYVDKLVAADRRA